MSIERDREWWQVLCGKEDVLPTPHMVKRWLFDRIVQAITDRAARERALLKAARERITALEEAIRPLLKGTKHSWDGIKTIPLKLGCSCIPCTARALLPENLGPQPEFVPDATLEAAAILKGRA